MICINIAKDFTTTPGGRYKSEGDNSGEDFRESLLKPKYLEARKQNTQLKVILDGCLGYPSSFLDESFGGLAKELKDKNLIKNIVLVSEDQPGLVEYIAQRIEVATNEL